MDAILASISVGISELKANPSAVLAASGDQPVAILNRNKPVAYMLSATAWEKIHELLDDQALRAIAEARLSDGQSPVTIRLDDL